MQNSPLAIASAILLAVASTPPAGACSLDANPGTLRLSKPTNGPLAAGFGYRRHPILGYAKLHPGWDYRTSIGTPVRAAASGRVTAAGYDGPSGNMIVIEHGGGLQTAYAHLSRIGVAQGTCVEAGAEIGAAGTSGLTTGPHLHFEVRKDGRAMDPGHWFAARAP
ncbi:M23 family metallopeptidase [Hyphomicrobium sp.]|uniref:M23 family metallopeptidase n=1 Tax=Hyphomicrobium sp. TaxID=82 RepID=UPI0025C22A80|nr:M23 family metallopeptidase [Hyphomicrobium sp.]MCC7250528.1 M23 family metallopeptidase [Hyphomicrobium sp.]